MRGDFRFADLTLLREGVKKEPRCFTDDEVRKIIANEPEPLSTIVAITAVLDSFTVGFSPTALSESCLPAQILRRGWQAGLINEVSTASVNANCPCVSLSVARKVISAVRRTL